MEGRYFLPIAFVRVKCIVGGEEIIIDSTAHRNENNASIFRVSVRLLAIYAMQSAGQRCVITLLIEFGYAMASLMHKMTMEIQL